MSVQCEMEDSSQDLVVSKRPKLALEHDEDYEKKKKIVDNYKKISAVHF